MRFRENSIDPIHAIRPDFVIKGEDVEGGQIRIMDSSHHMAPEFKISGQGHSFKIRAAGLDGQEKATLINGKSSYPGIEVR